ncbi:MAG: aldolase/citrate lyase family protein [Oscillospiraceae bacterium]|nr:aldolase/citrate lyase family protein [Oscillospiraceae bacterium]
MNITKMAEVFKEKLKTQAIGIFSKTSDPAFIEVMGFAGLDYVIIDLEHGPNTVQTAQNLIRAAQIAEIFPIVRVKEGCESVMCEALDIGAGGIQIPQITTKSEAEAAINRVKFHPDGQRGVCRFVRAADYSAKDRFQYFTDANKSVIILQIEGKEGIANIDEILNVKGIDVIFIGPYDLSQSLGLTGQIDHPAVEDKMTEIVRKCAEKGITVGTFVDTPANAAKWRSNGVRYISYSVDLGIFYNAVKDLVKNLSSSIAHSQ